MHFNTTIPFLSGQIRLHSEFIKQVPKDHTSEWACQLGVKYEGLLHINPDLLAGLTFPELGHSNGIGFDAYRKLLAWLYTHDDLMVDLDFLDGLQNQLDTNDHGKIIVCLDGCIERLTAAKSNLEWVHAKYYDVLGLEASCVEVSPTDNMVGLVKMFTDMGMY